MKTIDKIEIEYVIPESPEEKKHIEDIIANIDKEKKQKVNFDDYELVKNKNKHQNGFWKQIS